MRHDLVPGNVFPDDQLPDHTGTPLERPAGRDERDLPDWDVMTPGLREAWNAGKLSAFLSAFHVWNKGKLIQIATVEADAAGAPR